jgi:peptidoglycan/xylan/chitin deacetylase (PgdA/CDA1 family)
MENLWKANTPQKFWMLDPDPIEKDWQEAVMKALPKLGLNSQIDGIDSALLLTLGEGLHGPNHWELSKLKRLYYDLKPALPEFAINLIKKINAQMSNDKFLLDWPIEKRFVQFQWELIWQLLLITGQSTMKFRRFWPEGFKYALVLTHDIETIEGYKFVLKVADLEEDLGFRSSFNFVPERYELNTGLINELRNRGFEIGIHGLKHDGKLYSSKKRFMARAVHINRYLKKFGAVGFRSPLMHRHPEWLQGLDIEYDLSFFDTDPYEPMPGGCMSIWPFMIGHYVELPYTLPQDCTLTNVIGENSARTWLEKIDFIEQYCGMALLNTHPDYLRHPETWRIYVDFLETMKKRNNFWQVLPKDVAYWWRKRFEASQGQEIPGIRIGTLVLNKEKIKIE